MFTSFWEDPWLEGCSLGVLVFGFRGCSMFLESVRWRRWVIRWGLGYLGSHMEAGSLCLGVTEMQDL